MDYRAIIINQNGSSYDVQYSNGESIHNLDEKYIFFPQTVRTLELCSGNLFNYPDVWDCDICILETDFPPETHQELISGMNKTRLGCKFLTYHNLKRFPCYEKNKIKQLEINVYDSDRYPCSWSQGWRFYLWEHTFDTTKRITIDHLRFLNDVKYLITNRDNNFEIVKLMDIDHHNNTLSVCRIGTINIEIINPFFDSIYSPGFRHEIGEKVVSYWPRNLRQTDYSSQFELFFGQIDNVTPSGYTVVFEDGDIAHDVNPRWVFSKPNYLFKVGENVSACWPPNVQNKNCPERYLRFPGTISGLNADGTYAVEYFDGLHGGNVREMWIQNLAEEEFMEQKESVVLPPDPRKAYSWDVHSVCRWIELLGFPQRCINQFRKYCIDGNILLNLNKEDMNKLSLTKKETQLLCNKIYKIRNPDMGDSNRKIRCHYPVKGPALINV